MKMIQIMVGVIHAKKYHIDNLCQMKENTPDTPKKHRRKRIFLTIALVVLVLLVAFRLYLPTIVLRYVNKEINTIPDYQGHVNDITMSLWRGAYQIQGIDLNKLSGKVPVPFFSAKTIDLSVEWAALFHGAIVAKLKFYDSQVNFVSGPTEETSQKGMDSSWVDVVKKLMPISINRVDVINGEIHYMDFHSNPKVDISISNTVNKDKTLPATIYMSAVCFNTGDLSIDMALDPLNSQPTFEVKEKMKNVQLTSLNSYTEAYLKLKMTGGTFEIYTEIAAKDGAFEGYTKPLFHHIEIEKNIKENKNILHWIIANTAQLITNILSNPSHEKQFATRIPIKGTFKSPTPDTWAAIGGLLRNAFVQALTPTLDSTLHISTADSTAIK